MINFFPACLTEYLQTYSTRGRQRSRFRLEQQETQWSVPSAITEKAQRAQEYDLDENEPELVTADSITLVEKEVRVK